MENDIGLMKIFLQAIVVKFGVVVKENLEVIDCEKKIIGGY